jgi:NAD(P)-dependent dehydrogenase (short-subunit alcohol dehydrogenase family)
MDLQLGDKSVLVTGSTAGIGFAIASLFVEEGASVILNGRSENRVKEAAQRIREVHKNARLTEVAADLGTKEGIEKLTQRVSTIDILVNNLGIYEAKSFTKITDEDGFKIFEINVLSGVRLSRYYLPKMLYKNWGRIVFISSESGLNIPVEMVHYGVTKTAQIAVARGLAEMTAGTGVTVNSVLAGPTRSEGVEKFVNDMAKSRGTDDAQVETEFFNSVRPSSLLKRFESPEEIAAMVVYVSSPRASGTNGAALRVEGGVVRSIG